MGMRRGARHYACLRCGCLWPLTRACAHTLPEEQRALRDVATPAMTLSFPVRHVPHSHGAISYAIHMEALTSVRDAERGCAMFAEIAAALGRGEPVALVTVVKIYGAAPCAPGARLLVRAEGGVSGTLGGASTDARAREDALRALASGESGLHTYHLDPEGGESVGSCGATLEVFIEPLRPQPRLIVAGSGYVAQALARLCAPFGWRLALLDDRSEFGRAAALPDGVETAVGELPELIVAHH